jgi:hypothetical protein
MSGRQNSRQEWAGDDFDREEVGSIYVDGRAEGTRPRFIVSLVVGYPESPLLQTPIDALRAALELTRDQAADSTTWFVFDRTTGVLQQFRQANFDPDAVVSRRA